MLHGAKVSKSARRWAILGDMFELGQYAAEEHSAVGQYAAKTADELVLVGGEARHMAEAALVAGVSQERVHLFEADVNDAVALAAAREAAATYVRDNARPGDLVLVKGSLGMGMDSVVASLAANGMGAEPGTRGSGASARAATSTTLADLGLVRQPRR
jgi:UDP-N-acetylmuramoyl-tripeptide--D-alanyl-D-alanine ligase